MSSKGKVQIIQEEEGSQTLLIACVLREQQHVKQSWEDY